MIKFNKDCAWKFARKPEVKVFEKDAIESLDDKTEQEIVAAGYADIHLAEAKAEAEAKIKAQEDEVERKNKEEENKKKNPIENKENKLMQPKKKANK